MREFMKCVAEAVLENGVKGLAAMVPGGEFAYKVAEGAYKKYRDRQKQADQPKEIEALAQAGSESTKQEAVQAVSDAVAEVAKAHPQQAELSEADRARLVTYLTQIPATMRQSLKGPQDPTGRTVPATFAITSPDDLSKLLPPRAPRFKPGDPLAGKSGWVLDRPLGVGGFGEVWLARHERLASLVGAVKFCLGQTARDLQHESGVIDRVMRAGEHPHIVRLTDVSFDGPAPWLMYEYVPGGDLGDFIRTLQSRPPEERRKQAVAALRQIAAAVAHFHRLTPPVVHRDLKPNNILLDRVNKRLRITDFGIGGVAAKAALAEESRGGTTAAGRLLSYMRGSHTPLYASPQQRHGSDPDPRDDVHALGVIAFQLLTGRLDAEVKGNWQKRLKADGTPGGLIELIGDSTSDNPGDRPKDARAWSEALTAISATPDQPRTDIPATQREARSTPEPIRGTPSATNRSGPNSAATQPVQPLPPEPIHSVQRPTGSGSFQELKRPEVRKSRPQSSDVPTAPPLIAPVLRREVTLDVPGIWLSRLRGEQSAEWKRVTDTPAKVRILDNEVYSFSANGYNADIYAADIRFAGLNGLADLDCLQALDLRHTLITDRCLEALPNLPGLEQLDLRSCDALTTAGIEFLPKFASLRELNLDGYSKLSSAALKALGRIKTLRMLNLSACKVTDAGLRHLTGLAELIYLDLGGCKQVTDAGLTSLAALSSLRHLSLVGCSKITTEGLAAFEAAMPACHIELELEEFE